MANPYETNRSTWDLRRMWISLRVHGVQNLLLAEKLTNFEKDFDKNKLVVLNKCVVTRIRPNNNGINNDAGHLLDDVFNMGEKNISKARQICIKTSVTVIPWYVSRDYQKNTCSLVSIEGWPLRCEMPRNSSFLSDRVHS